MGRRERHRGVEGKHRGVEEYKGGKGEHAVGIPQAKPLVPMGTSSRELPIANLAGFMPPYQSLHLPSDGTPYHPSSACSFPDS